MQVNVYKFWEYLTVAWSQKDSFSLNYIFCSLCILYISAILSHLYCCESSILKQRHIMQPEAMEMELVKCTQITWPPLDDRPDTDEDLKDF
jgi:hypothetical protein